MKKLTALLLACTLVFILTGCSRVSSTVDTSGESGEFAPEVTSVPAAEATVVPEATQPEVLDIPLDLPIDVGETDLQDDGMDDVDAEPASEVPAAPSPTSSVDLSTYKFQQLMDLSFGFSFEYPSHWENLPGKHTACFREPDIEDGDFPARLAVTKKTLAHTPKSSALLSQFQSYALNIYNQYDPSTFELGELNENAKFIGQKAYEITYLAYAGEVEIKGYMVCCNIGRNVYVYHFCASYDDYTAMESMVYRIRDSVIVPE